MQELTELLSLAAQYRMSDDAAHKSLGFELSRISVALNAAIESGDAARARLAQVETAADSVMQIIKAARSLNTNLDRWYYIDNSKAVADLASLLYGSAAPTTAPADPVRELAISLLWAIKTLLKSQDCLSTDGMDTDVPEFLSAKLDIGLGEARRMGDIMDTARALGMEPTQ